MKMGRSFAAVVLLMGWSVAVTPRPQANAAQHTHNSAAEQQIDARVDALLARMTTDEKIGQVTQLLATDVTPEMIRKGEVGSILSDTDAAGMARLQKLAVEQSRLHIPILFGFDVIHGYRTLFPIPLAMAGSFDPAVERQAAEIAAEEASAGGQRWTFAPMVDIARDPRWGRMTEGAGEDPVLGAAMATAQVEGFQGGDLADPHHLLACVKHFAAYGAAEGGRDYNTAELSQATLRNIYLPPFHAAIRAGAGTLMTAFNDLNGVPGVENRFLLQQVLRKEWGFRGFVVADWDAVTELEVHGIATDHAQAAQEALTAGTDMDMHDGIYRQALPQLLRSGRVSMQQLNEAVRRILRVKFELGLFEHPYTGADAAQAQQHWLTPHHRAAARRAEERSAILLRNQNHLLPLAKSLHSIAVIGPLANDGVEPLGHWKGDGDPHDTVTILAGLKRMLPGASITAVKGVDVEGDSDAAAQTGIAQAVAAARKAQVAILALGETAEMSGEGGSRSSLDLPGHQEQLLEAVVKTGTPVVLLLMNGHPLSIDWAAAHVPAILELWEGGTEVGNAAADLLFGVADPGGKLPVSVPRAAGAVPVYYNHLNTGRPAASTRFSSRYLDLQPGPLYPFGYGLSYTTFDFSNLKLSAPQISPTGSVTVSATITNTGKQAGDEVAQLYIHQRVASMSQPVRELKAFRRVTLQPGQSRTVTFTLPARQLGFWDNDGHRRLEPGVFDLWIGDSSQGGLHTTLTLR